ncbi:MAG: hypothetical protein AAGF53_11155 [Pseudomonadota bacterium]
MQQLRKFSDRLLDWLKNAWKAQIMSRIKTLGLAALCTLTYPAAAVEDRQLPEIIANCTGLLSAEMEFAWLMNNPDADLIQKRRETFVKILNAVQDSTEAKRLLAHRIDAKMAHANLLSVVHFRTDVRRALWAKKQANFRKNQCENLLLDS